MTDMQMRQLGFEKISVKLDIHMSDEQFIFINNPPAK